MAECDLFVTDIDPLNIVDCWMTGLTIVSITVVLFIRLYLKPSCICRGQYQKSDIMPALPIMRNAGNILLLQCIMFLKYLLHWFEPTNLSTTRTLCFAVNTRVKGMSK